MQFSWFVINFVFIFIYYLIVCAQIPEIYCQDPSRITSTNPLHDGGNGSNSELVIFKNRPLGKYVEAFKKELEEHSTGKFRGMKKSVAQKKVEIVNSLMNEMKSAYDEIKSLNELFLCGLNDEGEAFLTSVQQELEQQKNIKENAEEAILLELMPVDEIESGDEITMEVTAGVGGQEAMLFAQDLFRLYMSYIDFKKWKSELTDYEDSELGGVRHLSLLVSGRNCYHFFRLEGGVHRVQRIPKTEKNGRIHTSTATVAVLPQPSEIDVVINQKDLKITTKTARGPGGQNVNKVETAVRILHIPSGIIVDCQTQRTQHENRRIAMEKLRAKLYEVELEKAGSEVQSLRKIQIGTKSRNEKVRTYNYGQDRITDHRFNVTFHNLEGYFQGGEHYDNFLHSILTSYDKINKKDFLDMLRSKYT